MFGDRLIWLMLWDWDVLVCAGLNPQSVSVAEEVMAVCHP